jgi:DNA-directed RNA polymerase subunit RPC12/RpoP
MVTYLCSECGNIEEFKIEEHFVKFGVVNGKGEFLRWCGEGYQPLDEPCECMVCGSGDIIKVKIPDPTDVSTTEKEIEEALLLVGIEADIAKKFSEELLRER